MAPHGPIASAACHAGQIPQSRPPLSLQQAVNELNDLAVRGRAEITCLDRLHEHLRATMRGPVPCNPNKDVEAPHLPLNDIPALLAEQMTHRARVMEQLAALLGAA